MPARNVVKTYVNNGYYHIYNRGVEKRVIFVDEQDYSVFLKYLKQYLSKPPDPEDVKTIFTLKGSTFKGIKRQPNNFHTRIELLSYCLMPNHFHLLVKQTEMTLIKSFMQSLLTSYSIYFNKKHCRVGALFQGTYRAVLITDDPYLLHLSRYIHLNPLEISDNLTESYSSYAEYLGLRKTKWVNTDTILNYFNHKLAPEFKKFNSYKDFVEKNKKDPAKLLGKLTLESASEGL